MAKLMVLPKLSVVMKEGTIINWYFKEGDEIKKGDVLYDVEAGKMGGSAESEEEGTLLKILVPAKLFLIDKRRFNYFYLKHCIE